MVALIKRSFQWLRFLFIVKKSKFVKNTILNRTELQNSIIRQVLNTSDNQLLDYLNSILNKGAESSLYRLSDFEKSIVKESISEYSFNKVISNDDLFSRNEKWLEVK